MKKTHFILVFLLILKILYSENETKIFVIPVKGEINRSLMVFIKRNIEKAKAEKATHVIFEIDTFGGRVDSALQITTIIGSCKEAQTIAYVPSQGENYGVSWSAGALIAFSCNKIFMAEGTSLGAAAPVYQTTEGIQLAPEKVVSPLRTQMAALAEKNGYPKNIALAMVDMDIELYEVYLDSKLIIATKEEINELEIKAKKDGRTFQLGKIISPKGKLLTLTYKEMKDYGISSGTVSSIEELLTQLGIKNYNLVRTEKSIVDKIIAFLTSTAVSGVLIAIALAALYMELKTPGFGLPGVVSIIAFLIIFTTNALLGRVGSLEILLFLLGAILLIIEIFLIPGFGITGISGIILMLVSLILSLQDFIFPTVSWQWKIIFQNLFSITSGIIGSIVIISILAPLIPKTPIFKKLSLDASQKEEEGFVAFSVKRYKHLIGKTGIAATILRPIGKINIDGEIIEAQSDGEYIEKGEKVQVIEVASNKIIVKKV